MLGLKNRGAGRPGRTGFLGVREGGSVTVLGLSGFSPSALLNGGGKQRKRSQ